MERSIGKFEVVEKIGEGGFGVIYKGLDPVIKRHVAIKCCTSDDQEVRDRFFHEARIAGNLHHRNVVTVYDFGLEDGVPYLVQEYLSGEDLDRKIKRKEYIPFPEKLLCLMQIARGLEYAHSQGVIHRDVKPANVRILEDGTAKLMDFGIAKLANQETGLTQTGMTLGTAAYLAPEQIRGEPVDRRTDIFSYGVMAYELLSYQRPFAGQHISTVLYQILNERPVPLRERFPECPERLEGLVARCLEKDPKRRYPSCAELLRDLDAMLRERRSARDTGNVLLAADLMASEMAATRAMRPAPPGATEPSVAAAHDGLDDLELAGGIDGDRTPRSISGTRAFRQRGFPWFRWIAATLLMAAAAVAVWQLRERSDRDSRGLATAETTPVAMAAAGGADAGAGPGGDATTARLDGAGGGEGPSDPAGAVAP
ncbi:MAG TPA: serine/threonine-protein kinase, partial [Thermoanaerobaculia bacterium]|nr:serine/threonine-protein kinase [Thermoanaerobaculia bacterium]